MRSARLSSLGVPLAQVVEHPGRVDVQDSPDDGRFGIREPRDILEQQGPELLGGAFPGCDALGELHRPAHLPLELLDDGRRVARRAEVREEEQLGLQLEEAPGARDRLVEVKLRRGRRGVDVIALLDVVAERVPAEEVPVGES